MDDVVLTSESSDDGGSSDDEEIDEFGFPAMLHVRFFSVNRRLTAPILVLPDGFPEPDDAEDAEDDDGEMEGGDDAASDAGNAEGDATAVPARRNRSSSALMTFRKEARMVIPRSILRSSKFFRTRFEGQWRGESSVEIEVPSPVLLDSFVVAIHSETFGNGAGGARCATVIDATNQFEMYQAANMLGLPSLIARTEKQLRESLSVRTLVRALQLGMRFRRRPLMRACYNWVKRNSAQIVDSTSAGGAAAAKASALALLGALPSFGEDAEPHQQIVYNAMSRKLSHGDYSAPIDLFEESVDAEHICKQRYFCPGLHTSLRPRDGDAYSAKLGKGFARTTKTYVQRRRTGGADDAAVFVVHLEATGKPIIAARWCVRRVPPSPRTHCPARRALPLTLLHRRPPLAPPPSLPPGNVIHISSTADDFTAFGETHLATVACNFLGTQFSIVDYGVPAGERADGAAARSRLLRRARLAHVLSPPFRTHPAAR